MKLIVTVTRSTVMEEVGYYTILCTFFFVFVFVFPSCPAALDLVLLLGVD